MKPFSAIPRPGCLLLHEAAVRTFFLAVHIRSTASCRRKATAFVCAATLSAPWKENGHPACRREIPAAMQKVQPAMFGIYFCLT